MRPLNTFVTEPTLEIASNFFMLPVIVAIADRSHCIEIDARPNYMDVLAAQFFVHHHNAGVTIEAELLLQRVNSLCVLFGR